MINLLLPVFLRQGRIGFLTALLSIAWLGAWAQAPAWQLALAAGQSGTDYPAIKATATDAAGNVYLTGSFLGTITFGNLTLTSAGDDDVFVVKWSNATKSFVWAQRAGGIGEEIPNAIAVRGSSIYVTGSFISPTARFGNTTLTNVNSNNYDPDVFVTKLTDLGTAASFTWAQRAGGLNSDYGLGLAVNGPSVYVVGNFYSGTAGFGSTTLTNANSNGYGGDVFVAKLTDQGASGSFIWAQQAGGRDYDYVQAVAVEGANVYLTGYFYSSTATFGNTVVTNANTGIPSTTDVYVAKLTDTGSAASFQWAQRAGGLKDDYARAIALKGTALYVAGNFESVTAGFGSVVITNAAAGTGDIFLTRLTDLGTTAEFAWTQRAGGVGSDYANGVAVNGTGVFISGGFKSPMVFDATTTLTTAGLYDVFLAEFTDSGSSGSFTWAQQGGGAGDDGTIGLGMTGTQVYLTGMGAPPITFGAHTVAATSSVAGYLAFLTDNTLLAAAGSSQLAETALYPNPAHREVSIQVPAVAGEAWVAVQLTDRLGRVVSSAVVALPRNGLRYRMDISALAPGLYSLRLKAGAAQTVRKLSVY